MYEEKRKATSSTQMKSNEEGVTLMKRRIDPSDKTTTWLQGNRGSAGASLGQIIEGVLHHKIVA